MADYRTAETGLQAIDLAAGDHTTQKFHIWTHIFILLLFSLAPNFIDVQRQVAALIRDKIVIGYELWNVLKVCLSLDLGPPTLK